MYVSMFQVALVYAALTVATSYEETEIRCTDNGLLVPSFKVCDGVYDCTQRTGFFQIPDSQDEDTEICAPRDVRTREPVFTSLTQPNGSLLLSWTWSVPPSADLAGYYLRGTSSDHTFQIALSPLLSEYTADCLRGYTQYTITLRPFYKYNDGRTKLGKAALLSVGSPLTVVIPHEEKDMRCRDNHQLVPSFKVCDGVLDCREQYDPYGLPHSEDENPKICAWNQIYMHELNFTSLGRPDGFLLLSWTWSVPPSTGLAGYYLRGTSSDHTFQTTLSPSLSEYTAGCLTRYSQYNMTLRPFYNDVDGQPKLGKAALLSVRSPATAPGAPQDILLHSQSGIEQGKVGELAVTIVEPISWNSNPVGFRLRWEQHEQRNEAARDFVLPVNKPGSKKDLVAKLPLKPGRTYTLFASARGVGDYGEVLLGPETSITAETVPEAPINFTAETIHPTSVVISWQATSPARRFVMYLPNYAPWNFLQDAQHHAHPDNQYAFRGPDLSQNFVWIDGSSQESSFYRLPVLDLLPCMEYKFEVMACGVRAECSNKATLVFTTPPSGIPTPDILKILSNGPSSLYLECDYTPLPQVPNLNLEFEVIVKRNGFYRVIRTLEKAITIGNLSSGAEYEVEVVLSLERKPGMRENGSPARATVSTWPLAPRAPALSTTGFAAEPDIAVVSWSFLNSSVTHVEFATNKSSWMNCENTTECDLVVFYSRDLSFTTGFVMFSELKPYTTYSLSVRGCNGLECGDDSTVLITTVITEPSEPNSLTVNATEDDSAYLEWKAPSEPGGPLTGYVVSWQCGQGHVMAATTYETFLTIPGLPNVAQECTFSVSAFNMAKGERQLHGKSAILKTPWPPQK